MSVTRAQLRSLMARAMGRLIAGTTTANGNAGGTNLICSSLQAEVTFPGKGDSLIFRSGTYIHDGTPATRYRVDSFDKTTGTLTFLPATGGQIVTGTTFEIYREIDVFDFNNAINQAIRETWQPGGVTVGRLVKSTTALSFSHNVFEYDLPATAIDIHRVLVRETSGSPLKELTSYYVIGEYGSREVVFRDSSQVNPYVGCEVTLWYYQRYQEANEESDEIDVPYFIVAAAITDLYRALLTNSVNDEDIATNQLMVQMWNQKAETLRRAFGVAIAGHPTQRLVSSIAEGLRGV